MRNKLEPAVLRNNKSTGVEVQEILQMMKLDEDWWLVHFSLQRFLKEFRSGGPVEIK
jgi:hypothetical protein